MAMSSMIHARCNIVNYWHMICNITMLTCNVFILINELLISTCKIIRQTCKIFNLSTCQVWLCWHVTYLCSHVHCLHKYEAYWNKYLYPQWFLITSFWQTFIFLQVDIFSFGMFFYELLTCKKPLEDVTNPTLFICQNGRPSISRRVSSTASF